VHTGASQVATVKGLEGCPALEVLSLRDNRLRTLRGLRPGSCARLRSLTADLNQLTDLRGLAACVALRKLSVCSNQLVSLRGLRETLEKEQLVEQDGSGAPATTRTGGGGQQLESLWVSNNMLTALGDALMGCTALQHLDVTSNRLTSLRGLERCSLLTTLAASDNCLRSLPLAPGGLRAPLLRRLWLGRNQLTRLPDLSGLPHLESLHVQDNALEALAPLVQPHPHV
jgi:Leucine-rich repeat (LRR) protein